MKPSGAPGARKTKLDRSQKSLRIKLSLEAAAPQPLASSILTQVLGRGRFRTVGDSLSLRAGEPLELRCRGKVVHWRVPKYLEEEGEGRLRYGVENSLWQPEWVQGWVRGYWAALYKHFNSFFKKD